MVSGNFQFQLNIPNVYTPKSTANRKITLNIDGAGGELVGNPAAQLLS